MSLAWSTLGQKGVPAGWRLRRTRDLVELVNGFPFDSALFGPEGTFPLVRIRDLHLDEFATFVSGHVPDTVILRDGDIVIGMDGEFEVVLWRRGPAALNQRMCALRPRDGVDARFVAYALPRQLKVINDLTYATTVKHLSSFDILAERIALPPYPEQVAIADYLDAETRLIDIGARQLRARSRLLNERLRSRIVEDTNRTRRQVPLKRVAERVKTGGTPAEGASGEVPWYTPASFGDRLAMYEPVRTVPKEWVADGTAVAFPANSTLVVGIGATAGRVAFLDHPASGNQQLTAITPTTACDPRFLAWQLWAISDLLRGIASTTTLPIIGNDLLKGVPVAVPSRADQAELAEVWSSEAARIERLERAADRQVDTLVERRQALIAAAVTGQLEIPGVAA